MAATTQGAAPHPTFARAEAGQDISSPSPAVAALTSAASRDPSSLPALVPASSTRRSSFSSPKMLFGNLYKSTRRLRQQPPLPDMDHGDPDLISKDKAKQKDAVRRFLATKIRNDWEFQWPRPTQPQLTKDNEKDDAQEASESPLEVTETLDADVDDHVDDHAVKSPPPAGDLVVEEVIPKDDDAASIYSTMSEDGEHFRRRVDWTSDFSSDDEPTSPGDYRFDSPDAVGCAVRAAEIARASKRRRAAREESEWNQGLACFLARRDAWTEAKTVRVRPRPVASITPISPASKRHSIWRFSNPTSPVSPPTDGAVVTSPLSRAGTRTSGENSAASVSDTDSKETKRKSHEDSSSYPVETLLPIPRPLLPPANPMRASITPASYLSIYDKIVVHSMTPACPINVSDIIRSCVVGWKRDGEWPPRLTEQAALVAVRKKKKESAAAAAAARSNPGRRLSLGGFLGRRESAAGADTGAVGASPTQDDDVTRGDAAVMYGGLESYHKMCRFYSGFFFNHPLLLKYEWYWRVEPEISYFCDITYDPFQKMIEHNKTYGFTIAVKELRETVPNIFRYASAYKRLNNITSKGLWEMFVEPPEDDDEDASKDSDTSPNPEKSFWDTLTGKKENIVDPESMEGETYNMCHFWSNFEIAKLSWFRSKEYQDFFEMMDRSGGFWMERWGDAPIHSLAAGALLGPQDIHYFRDFGYRHTTIQHCPANAPGKQLEREPYLEKTTFPEYKRFEEDDYWEHWDDVQEGGIGCRCRCDTDVVDVEGKEGSCLAEWVDVAGGWEHPY